MKLTDLRVGNTVYYSSDAGNTFRIIGNITVDDLADFQNHPKLCEKRFKPVLLTDPVLNKVKIEIGTKIGILFDSKYNLDIKNDVTRMSLAVYATERTGNFKFVAELHGEHGFVVLKEVLYLHELQNLVYTLSGKEVKFYGV